MTELVAKVVDFWNEYGDARTSQWLLTKDPRAMLVIIFVYLVFVLKILPAICGHRKREHLRFWLGIYCFAHSYVSCIFLILQAYIVFLTGDSIFCMRLHENFEGTHYHGAILGYCWLVFKLTEMTETILTIVITGRASLFEYLHHALHPLAISFFVHFSPGGTSSLWASFNNFEHSMLYFVLALRNVSPDLKEMTNPWFKKFHIILSICFFSSALTTYMLLDNGPACDPAPLKQAMIACIAFFFFISVTCRWEYITRDDAFGRTKVVRFIELLLENDRKVGDDVVIESPCLGYTYTVR